MRFGSNPIEGSNPSLSASSPRTSGIKGAGSLFCWGINDNGQLGIGSTDSQDLPVQVGTASDWTSVSVGGYQTAGLRTGGALYTWGRNTQGQLGRHVWLPLQVTAGDLPPTNRDGSNWLMALVVLAGLTAAAGIALRARGAKRAQLLYLVVDDTASTIWWGR